MKKMNGKESRNDIWRVGMKFDSFFNMFGREEEWNQVLILII